LSLSLVGPEVDEKQWMGTRVGIRSVSFIAKSSGIDSGCVSTIRWLYSSCRQCEICEINHTVCPYQKNAGAVSCSSPQIMCPAFLPLLITLMVSRMYLEPSNVSGLSMSAIIQPSRALLISCPRVYCQSSTPCDKDSGAAFTR
jgi:propanol-preferring alcohol dehydrogenase